MPRHSKNNTALSFFTYAESQALNYGTKKQRLGRDSMRECDACYLCLQRARDPVCCSHGHLYCKECIYENILAQKKEIKRQQLLFEQREKDEEEAAKRKEELAKEALILDFERQQVRVAPTDASFSKSVKVIEKDNESKLTEDEDNIVTTDKTKQESRRGSVQSEAKYGKDSGIVKVAGKKRGFQLDEDEILAISKREHEESLKRLEEKQIKASKPKLPNFWLPSLTPSADPDKTIPIKRQTMCTAAESEHPISIKSLIPTKFTEVAEINSKKKSFVCPSCRKGLTNTVKINLLKTCGHVICGVCVDKFVSKAHRCFVCEAKCKEKDIADMSGEGTGFASGGGKVVAQKFDVAFQ
ncbi:10893_t:CDS:2 [Ambispora gerdemannii]|uniref:10893_t:CDS:1 n=1 Tax=Ambispora gerdemannii TaxID=144530 RepID=A0A9N8V752_9GLOM|nr:10893_t:CDS:2 [Ambispora gerdemannii]